MPKKKQDNFLKRIWKEHKMYFLLLIIFILISFYGMYAMTSMDKYDRECKQNGYEGTTTLVGIPVGCYIDNREFKEQTNKINFYPLP